MCSVKSVSQQCKVRQCFQCQGDTCFYCNTCEHDLCESCKEMHVMDPHTIKKHDVVIYREKFEAIKNQETCERHTGMLYKKYCISCNTPFCFKCVSHNKHETLGLRKAYKTYRQQHSENISRIRSGILYNSCAFLKRLKTEIRATCHIQQKIETFYQESVFTKYRGIMEIKDIAIRDIGAKYKRYLLHRLHQQQWKMALEIHVMEQYEHEYEHSANMPIQFLLFIKKTRIPTIRFNFKQMPQLSLPREFNTALLRNIKIKMKQRTIQELHEFIKIEDRVDLKLKIMSTALLKRCVKVSDIRRVCHISCFTNDMVWVSDRHNLRLINTTGDTILRITDIHRDSLFRGTGVHTVTKYGELIYIDSCFNISKLSLNSWENITLRMIPKQWRAHCIYSSPSSGDILVGLWRNDITAIVARYNSKGSSIQCIVRSDTDRTLYRNPTYITENHNGDIVVSDAWLRAVVVTDRTGRYRFSYTGPNSEQRCSPWEICLEPPSERKFLPWGICIDVFSHILVCSQNTVQMIDKDGNFLSLLLTEEHGISRPRCLSYDHKSHLLWVGNWCNTFLVYRYIKKRGQHQEGNYFYCQTQSTIKGR